MQPSDEDYKTLSYFGAKIANISCPAKRYYSSS